MKATTNTTTDLFHKTSRLRLELGLNIIAVMIIVCAACAMGLNEQDRLQNLANNQHCYLILGFSVMLMVICAITPLPAEAVTLTNGLLFGPLTGSLISWLSAMLGAYIAFLWSKRYADPIKQKIQYEKKWSKIFSRIHQWGPLGFLLARLVPTVPFFALNIGAAFLPLTTRSYLAITGLAIVPHILIINYFGAYFMHQ